MDSLFEEVFGAVVAPEELTEISEDEQYHQHAMSLYERIRRCEDKATSSQEIEEEIIQSAGTSQRQILVDVSPSKTLEPEKIRLKDMNG
jgi:hypothetical protein